MWCQRMNEKKSEKKWIARKTEELIPEQENVNILTKSL